MHPGRDRERGRIWRVVHRSNTGSSDSGTVSTNPALPRTAEGLIGEFSSKNLARRMLAMNELYDRFGKEAIDPAKRLLAAPSVSRWEKVHSLWLLERLSALSIDQIRAAAADADPAVRVHTMRILASRGRNVLAHTNRSAEASNTVDVELGLARSALSDAFPLTQRCASEALGYRPRIENVQPLLDLRALVSPVLARARRQAPTPSA